jgi:hypothetical protein
MPHQYAVLVVDAESSAAVLGVDEPALRGDIRTTLEDALDASGVPWSDLAYSESTGDGWLVVTGLESSHLLVDPLLDVLNRRLQVRNRIRRPRLRLRVALHQGVVHLPTTGPHLDGGAALTEVHRLVDDRHLRHVLAHSKAGAALIVSDAAYRTVVLGGYTEELSSDAFARVEVEVKDYRAAAWIHVPGYHRPPLPGDGEPAVLASGDGLGRPAPPPRQLDSVQVRANQVANLVNGTVHGGMRAGDTIGGDKNVGKG